MFVGNLIADESKAIKKRKKKDTANSFVNGASNDENARDLNGEALPEPEENVQTKRLKSHEGTTHSYFPILCTND